MTAPPRIDVRRGRDRFVTRPGWAQTWHSFSFGEHYDPDNVGFGALLVHNDETVVGGAGYDAHLHRDAEIVTWVLSGALTHSDSTGRRDVVRPGVVQRLSAGSGVTHAERNDGAVPVRFVQAWLRPDVPGREPSYATGEVDPAGLDRGWVPVASGSLPEAAVGLGTVASTLWVARLATGDVRTLPRASRLHVFVARGSVAVDTVGSLAAGDALRIDGPADVELTGVDAAEVLAWELAA